jgi:hypothetical protein
VEDFRVVAVTVLGQNQEVKTVVKNDHGQLFDRQLMIMDF